MRQQFSLYELITPEDIPVIKQRAREQAQYDREHSIVCRHHGLFMVIGFALLVVPLLPIFYLGWSNDVGSLSGINLIMKLMPAGAAGVLLLLFCMARPGSKNWATAWTKVFVGLGITLVLGVLVSLGLLSLLNGLPR